MTLIRRGSVIIVLNWPRKSLAAPPPPSPPAVEPLYKLIDPKQSILQLMSMYHALRFAYSFCPAIFQGAVRSSLSDLSRIYSSYPAPRTSIDRRTKESCVILITFPPKNRQSLQNRLQSRSILIMSYKRPSHLSCSITGPSVEAGSYAEHFHSLPTSASIPLHHQS